MMVTFSKQMLVASLVIGGLVTIGMLFGAGIARIDHYGRGIRWPDYAPLVVAGLWAISSIAVGVALHLSGKVRSNG